MWKLALFSIFALAIAACFWLIEETHLEETHVEITGGEIGTPYYGIISAQDPDGIIHFDLVDPECAPEEILNKIMHGYYLMIDTKEHVPQCVGNRLRCNNCHFNAGNTLGGKNRGISLLGVTEIYPRFSKRAGREISLEERINNCFRRSMNGVPPPPTSVEMQAMLAYLAWISHGLSDAPMLPWLGLDRIRIDYEPDAKRGEEVYYQQCAICHGTDGNGSEWVPPLWGDDSFNDGAGMNTLPMLSAFAFQNMPYGQPELSEEEALDVAAFIISRPRPHFTP